ncbi:uncharacterized protein LOC133322779 [Musca vetustissima]|uniref:uncharacterized protein LOC133322779 n=1 Tax=Musca vetustissima TaxID=27455 RepID=UPI002AB64261|nr:uncharacterized protein LOC133322779 [Musca vetustissima]
MGNCKQFFTSKGAGQWFLWSITLIFITALCTFTILEVKSLEDEEPSVIRIILNTITQKSAKTNGDNLPTNNQFVLVNVESVQGNKAIVTQEEGEEVGEDNTTGELERKVRDTEGNTPANVNKTNNSYYEEQTPVLVYSKTDQEPPLSYRQSAPTPFEHGSHEEQPYYDDSVNDDHGYYRPQYDDDSREDFPGPQDYPTDAYSDQGRSSQNQPYDSYYRQWHYATPSPVSSASSSSVMATQSSQGNRKLQTMTSAPNAGDKHRDPYYDYDYFGYRQRSPPYHPQQQQMQSYHPSPSTTNTAVQKQKEESSELNLITILKTIKTMWDLYQSFISAWNSMAEHQNRQEELRRQKLEELQQQQKLRINSKKPTKIENRKKPENNNNKNPKTNAKQTTTKGPSTKVSTTTLASSAESSTEEEEMQVTSPKVKQQLNKAKVEPRKAPKGEKTAITEAEGLRTKRQTASESTDVGEGRYIKGDPLKGYYDFVITEGSYKFWAVFQVGTALLIIYSTFAAIYYSKVNPLVSDYDYTDYLGGARSLSGGDLDFVDDETTENGVKQSKGWLDWLPRTGHSLKFILDAIDKLPVDHDVAKEANGNAEEWLESTTADNDYSEDESSNNKAM